MLEAGLEEARLRGSRMIVVNSTRGDTSIDDRFATGEALDRLRARLTSSGVDFELIQPIQGHNADEEVLDVAARFDAKLIVIGLRHRNALGKLIMGSTAQRILVHATSSVLAVKEIH